MWSRVVQSTIHGHEVDLSSNDDKHALARATTFQPSTHSTKSRSNTTVYVSAEEIKLVNEKEEEEAIDKYESLTITDKEEIIELPKNTRRGITRYPGSLHLPATANSSNTLQRVDGARRVTFSSGVPPTRIVHSISDYEKEDDYFNCMENAFRQDQERRRQNQHRRHSSRTPRRNSIVVNTWRHAIVLVGWLIAVFVAIIDTLAVSIAAPAMASSYRSFDRIVWLGAAHLLASTIGQPIANQLGASSSLGRRGVVLSAVPLLLIASGLAAFAPTFTILIIARAMAGLSSGAITCIAKDSMQEHMARKYSATIQKILTTTSVLATLIGPLFGGALNESFGWPALFYVIMPFGCIALTLLSLLPRRQLSTSELIDQLAPNVSIARRVGRSIRRDTVALFRFFCSVRPDLLGATLLGIALMLFLQSTSWAGRLYHWVSPIIISLYGGACAILAIFIIVEWRWTKHPIVNPIKHWTRNLWIGSVLSFNSGAIYTALLYYLPVWFQLVHATSSLDTGLWMLPLLVVAQLTGFITGWLLQRWETRFTTDAEACSRSCFYKSGIDPAVLLLVAGQLLTVLGTGLLGLPSNMPRTLTGSTITTGPQLQVMAYIALIGCGLGLTTQSTFMTAKRSFASYNISAVTQTITLARNIGGIIGLAVASSVFTNVFRYEIHSAFKTDNALTNALRLEKDPRLLIFESDTAIQAHMLRCLAQQLDVAAPVARAMQPSTENRLQLAPKEPASTLLDNLSEQNSTVIIKTAAL
ncbi:major facilitator superfamily domain-containing protein [Syncephalis fuscata]|nr:major facilitator superfamily domain-containing protein [Syncephalis fuscata]